MKSSKLTDRIKAAALAVGLSVLPAKEVGSGVSYGGGVGVDFGGNVLLRGQIVTKNEPKSFGGKFGVDYVLIGEDKGKLGLSGGVAYLFPNGLTISGEGIYKFNSKNPFSLGLGVGFGNVKKDGGDGNSKESNIFDGCGWYKDQMAGDEEVCKERCVTTDGTWVDGYCECPEGAGLLAGGECYKL